MYSNIGNLRLKYENEMYPVKKYAAKDECVYLLYFGCWKFFLNIFMIFLLCF